MARKQKHKAKKHQHLSPEAVLTGREQVTAHQLIRLIHQVNPTEQGLPSDQQTERYEQKARLQSLLIQRFGEQLQVQMPDPDQPHLVGLRLKHFDDDACHALVDELDEDARRWVWRQLDEGQHQASHATSEKSDKSTKPQDRDTTPAPASEPPEGVDVYKLENATVTELLALGHEALENYDYPACEAYFEKAFLTSGGEPEATQAYFNLLVDHLAMYERAFAQRHRLSKRAAKDETIRLMLAEAAAQTGAYQEALTWVEHSRQPRASQVLLLVARHHIEQEDIDRASQLMETLQAYQEASLEPEIAALQQQIDALRSSRWGALEQQMLAAWQQQQFDEALSLAEELLQHWPHNRMARQIRRDVAEQRRESRVADLLQRADQAREARDFAQEVSLRKQAVAEKPEDEALVARLIQAETQAQAVRDQANMDEVLQDWSEGAREKALLQFAMLGKDHQATLIELIDAPHFAWLQQVLSAQGTRKVERAVSAILCFEQCLDEFKRGEVPQAILLQLQKHMKVLRALPEANALVEQVEARAQDLAHEQESQVLQQIEALLAAEDLKAAREALDHVKVKLLSAQEKESVAKLHHQLHHQEQYNSLLHKYELSLEHQDHLEAKQAAKRLMTLMKPEQAAEWQEKIHLHNRLLCESWHVIRGAVELPLYFQQKLGHISTELHCCVLPEQQQVLLASTHERWVMLKRFCIQQQKIIEVTAFQMPQPAEFPDLLYDGNSFWLLGHNLVLLEFALEPFEIRSWFDGTEISKGYQCMEYSKFFPRTRTIWLQGRSKHEEECQVLDIDQRRILRRPTIEMIPTRIPHPQQDIILSVSLDQDTVQTYSGQGKLLRQYKWDMRKAADAVALHPNGEDYALLTFTPSPITSDPEESDDDYIPLTLETLSNTGQTFAPYKLEQSYGEVKHELATSLEQQIVFAQYSDSIHPDDPFFLAAFQAENRSWKQLYRVPVSREVLLIQDAQVQNVYAIDVLPAGLQVTLLGSDPPPLEPHQRWLISARDLPAFQSPLVCYEPTGALRKLAQSMVTAIENDPAYVHVHMDILKSEQGTPEALAAFAIALKHLHYYPLYKEMEEWLVQRYPHHFRARIVMAHEAAEEQQWQQVLSHLESLPWSELDHGTALHAYHLQGMAYFGLGDEKAAIHAWKQGQVHEGHGSSECPCRLFNYLEYAQQGQKPFGKKENPAKMEVFRKHFYHFHQIDTHLAAQNWEKAIEWLESPEYAKFYSIQLQARWAKAYLQLDYQPGEMRWFCKLIAIASFRENYPRTYGNKSAPLPSIINTWTNDQLEEVYQQAQQWLEQQTHIKKT